MNLLLSGEVGFANKTFLSFQIGESAESHVWKSHDVVITVASVWYHNVKDEYLFWHVKGRKIVLLWRQQGWILLFTTRRWSDLGMRVVCQFIKYSFMFPTRLHGALLCYKTECQTRLYGKYFYSLLRLRQSQSALKIIGVMNKVSL